LSLESNLGGHLQHSDPVEEAGHADVYLLVRRHLEEVRQGEHEDRRA
jgi:hypothetical protein